MTDQPDTQTPTDRHANAVGQPTRPSMVAAALEVTREHVEELEDTLEMTRRKLERTIEERDDWRRWHSEKDALIGYLHGLALDATDFEVKRLGSGVTDDGWKVTVIDGNQERQTGRYYPGSSIDALARWILRYRTNPLGPKQNPLLAEPATNRPPIEHQLVDGTGKVVHRAYEYDESPPHDPAATDGADHQSPMEHPTIEGSGDVAERYQKLPTWLIPDRMARTPKLQPVILTEVGGSRGEAQGLLLGMLSRDDELFMIVAVGMPTYMFSGHGAMTPTFFAASKWTMTFDKVDSDEEEKSSE